MTFNCAYGIHHDQVTCVLLNIECHNVTNLQCKHKGKYTLNVNIIFEILNNREKLYQMCKQIYIRSRINMNSDLNKFFLYTFMII